MNLQSNPTNPANTKPGSPPQSIHSQPGSVQSSKASSSHASSSDHSNDSDSPEEAEGKSPMFAACRPYLDKLKTIDAANLELNPTMGAGIWDEWGVYYCSSRFGRHTSFNPNYFALTAIVIVGHSNFFNLIHLMNQNGGLAFLVVLAMTYIAFGYPAYIIEVFMGQYSGRKPILMIRNMMPILQGLGVAFYIRTVIRAIDILAVFAYCVYHCWDLLFCKGHQSVLLKRILHQERNNTVFKFGQGLVYPYQHDIDPTFTHEKPWLLLMSAFTFFATTKKLKEFGAGMKVVLRLLLLFLAGYTFNGFMRSRTGGEIHPDSILLLPLKITFDTDWGKLLDGWVWVRAIVFVIHSMELGTLVHPYLGSKVFFHNRLTRDGVYLVLVSFTWNVIGALGVLFWLGYVGINKDEIRASFTELQGHYGMFVVFILKHLQAELAQQVESDVMLFCSLFYLIIGIAALLAFLCYLYIIVDCSYPESGHPLLKLSVYLTFSITIGAVIYPLLLTQDGIRHMTFLKFYLDDSWVPLFVIICYVSAVAWSQGMARVLHDFYNIVHLKGYEVRTHFYQIPKIAPFLFIGFLLFAMISEAADRTHPTEGYTIWTDPGTLTLGFAISFIPALMVALGALLYVFYDRKNKDEPLCKPHRDFYKNKHHVSVCFKDYETFNMQKGSVEKLSK